jgi:3-hydroxyisobutyrate dehydrogenase
MGTGGGVDRGPPPHSKERQMNITILGQGAMGSRMADRLETAGFPVTRWNRTGASLSPRQAVSDADIVIAMLRDDIASRQVWLDSRHGAVAGLRPGALAIESSTLSVDWVRGLAAAMAAAGHDFLDAPVLGSRPQAEAGQLVHLIGGEAALIDQARPVLAAIGNRQLHAGPAGSGAALKLVANALFGVQVAAVAELLARMGELGLDTSSAVSLLAETPVLGAAAKAAAGLMLAGRHDAMFPVDLVTKDFAYLVQDRPDAVPLSSATLAVFHRAQAAGLGAKHLTAVSTLYARGSA